MFQRDMAEANEAIYEVFSDFVEQLSSALAIIASRISKLVLVITFLRGRFRINCPSANFENFDIALVNRGQFQNFENLRG